MNLELITSSFSYWNWRTNWLWSYLRPIPASVHQYHLLSPVQELDSDNCLLYSLNHQDILFSWIISISIQGCSKEAAKQPPLKLYFSPATTPFFFPRYRKTQCVVSFSIFLFLLQWVLPSYHLLKPLLSRLPVTSSCLITQLSVLSAQLILSPWILSLLKSVFLEFSSYLTGHFFPLNLLLLFIIYY